MYLSNYNESGLLNASLTQVQQLLTTWVNNTVGERYDTSLIFGQKYDQNGLTAILQAWQNQDFSLIPPIKIVTPQQLKRNNWGSRC